MPNNIAYFRYERAQWTQSQFAEALSGQLGRTFDQTQVSRLENAENPNINVLLGVRDTLNQRFGELGVSLVTVDDLISVDVLSSIRPKRRIITLCSEKGGVGKSTLSFHIACAFALSGKNTMLVDLDSQLNCSQSLVSLESLSKKRTVWNLFSEYLEESQPLGFEDIEVVPEYEPLKKHLRLGPAHRRLSWAERLFNYENTTAPKILKTLLDQYDFPEVVVIDCPGNVGVLTLNALVAANEVIIPSLIGPYEAQAIVNLYDTFDAAKRLNPNFQVRGVIFNKYQERTRLAKLTEKAVNSLGYPTFKTKLPRYVTIPEAIQNRQPVFEFAPKEKAGQIMRTLMDEVINY